MDRSNGMERGTIRLAGRTILPVRDDSKFLGHLIPVGGPARLAGISLLETQARRALWDLHFPPADTDQEVVTPGVATPSVAVFQTRKHLFGVNPANGELLWRRSDLDMASGNRVDNEAGLFGDDKGIVMFHRDQKAYTLYATRTGEVLRQDQLDIDFRYSKYVFGRRLFFRTSTDQAGGVPEYRVWDPLSNTFEFVENQVTRFYHDKTSRDELAVVNTTGRLRILKFPETAVLADLDLGHDAIRTMTGLNVFSDDDTIFVNLHSSVGRGGQLRWMRYHASDVMLPVTNVNRGQLLAIDRATGRIRWQTASDQRTYLRMDTVKLPFLIGLSQMGARAGANLRTHEIELLDRKTGEVIGTVAGVPHDRIVFCKSFRDEGLIELHGTRSRIDLRFNRGLQGILLEQGPL